MTTHNHEKYALFEVLDEARQHLFDAVDLLEQTLDDLRTAEYSDEADSIEHHLLPSLRISSTNDHDYLSDEFCLETLLEKVYAAAMAPTEEATEVTPC